MNSYKQRKGFTLIELLVVIAIVGILAGLAAVNMSGATEAARIAKLKVYSNSIRSSLMGNRVSEWIFDEGAGTTTTADTVGTNNGTFFNFNFDSTDGWRTGSSCVLGWCLQFDGTDDYINTVSNVGIIDNQARTVTLWFKPSDKQGRQDLFSFGGTTTSKMFNIIYDMTNEGIYFGGYADDTGGHTNTITRNAWNFVATTYNGSVVKVFINGNTAPDISASHALSTGPSTLYMGKSRENVGNYKGLIDEVRIYDSALTASVIRDQYVAGLDKLLASGQVTDRDYQQRIAELSSTYATNK
jgi:prepilin-type N-terminal cleavage/methylation domain-containing protein